MSYNENYPIDSIQIKDLPGAIRQKGRDLKSEIAQAEQRIETKKFDKSGGRINGNLRIDNLSRGSDFVVRRLQTENYTEVCDAVILLYKNTNNVNNPKYGLTSNNKVAAGSFYASRGSATSYNRKPVVSIIASQSWTNQCMYNWESKCEHWPLVKFQYNGEPCIGLKIKRGSRLNNGFSFKGYYRSDLPEELQLKLIGYYKIYGGKKVLNQEIYESIEELKPNRAKWLGYSSVISDGNIIAPNTIVESGSNKNGEYVKWNNGLMMCWAHKKITVSGKIIHWNFPAIFKEVPVSYANTNTQVGSNHNCLASFPYTPNITQTTRRVGFRALQEYNKSCNDGTILNMSLSAIGRWK